MCMCMVGGEEWDRDRESFEWEFPQETMGGGKGGGGKGTQAHVCRQLWKMEKQDPFRSTQTSVGLGHQAQGRRDLAWDVAVGKLTRINP